MSLYQEKLRKAINEQKEVIKQFKIHIQETEIELKNEVNVFEKVRFMKRLRALRNTKLICEENLKRIIKQIY